MKGMEVIHQNPVYTAAIAVLLAIALAGVFLSRNAIHRENIRESRSAVLADRLRIMRSKAPGVSTADLTALKTELDALDREIAGYADTYTATHALESSRDPAVVLPRIQGLLMQYRRLFRERGIRIGEGETFGFSRYEEGANPSDAAAIAALNKQVQIIGTLLDLLLECEPSVFLSMEREWVEGAGSGQVQVEEDVFRIDPYASAYVPGLVETLAFRVRFAGHTEALRRFMNALSGLELPILVREVEVGPYHESRKEAHVGDGTLQDSLFSVWFENGEHQSHERLSKASGEQQPVIEENYSEFTVVLEYIELYASRVTERDEGKGDT